MTNEEKVIKYYVAQGYLSFAWQSHDPDKLREALAYNNTFEHNCTGTELKQLQEAYSKSKAEEIENPTFEEVIDCELEHIAKKIDEGEVFTSFSRLQSILENEISEEQISYANYLISLLDDKFQKLVMN